MATVEFEESVAVLAAGDKTPWMKCIGISGSDLTVTFIIGGAGVATLNVAEDTDDSDTTKTDKLAWETFSASTSRVLPAPLPNFIQFQNTGPSGTVTVGLGHGRQHNGVAAQPTAET